MRLGDQRSEGAVRRVLGSWPIKTVLLALRAQQPLRVLHAFAVAVDLRIFALRIHVGLENLDGRELVLADAPIEDFFLASRRVEAPGASILNDRNGERVFVLADDEDGASITLLGLVRFLVCRQEALARRFIRDIVTGACELFALGAKHRDDLFRAPVLHRRDERLDGRLRRSKGGSFACQRAKGRQESITTKANGS